jgi:hypothetical protein
LRRFREPIFAGVFLLYLLVFLVGGYIWTTHTTGRHVTSKRIDVTIAGGKSMYPSTWTAHQNDFVTINIASDADGEVHLHGYDIKWELVLDSRWTKSFVADKTGDFPIEWETTGTRLGDFKVSP